MCRFKLSFLIAFLTFGISIIAYSIFDVKTTAPISSKAPENTTVSTIVSQQELELITPISTEKITQDRDLSLYDFGGHHEVITNSREFIWKHWKNKQRGYIIIGGKHDDFTNRTHIFIEPDRSGLWRIVMRRQKYFGTDEYQAIVEEYPDVRSVKEGRRSTCIGERNQLLFRDKDGNEVLSF